MGYLDFMSNFTGDGDFKLDVTGDIDFKLNVTGDNDFKPHLTERGYLDATSFFAFSNFCKLFV